MRFVHAEEKATTNEKRSLELTAPAREPSWMCSPSGAVPVCGHTSSSAPLAVAASSVSGGCNASVGSVPPRITDGLGLGQRLMRCTAAHPASVDTVDSFRDVCGARGAALYETIQLAVLDDLRLRSVWCVPRRRDGRRPIVMVWQTGRSLGRPLGTPGRHVHCDGQGDAGATARTRNHRGRIRNPRSSSTHTVHSALILYTLYRSARQSRNNSSNPCGPCCCSTRHKPA